MTFLKRKEFNMVSFDKMHGNGNDFIVLNSIENPYKLSQLKSKKLCKRNFDIGFDQVILIQLPKKDDYDFSTRFFNADGSEASMCLNGIRCAASYIWRNNFAPKKSITFKTKNSLVVCEPHKNQIKASLQMPSVHIDTKLELKISKFISGKFIIVNAGNMHLCIKSSSVKNKNLNLIYKNLEKIIKPSGINLTIYKVIGQTAEIRTYENGVGETFSCGSASLAVASLCIKDKFKTVSPGGELSFINKNGANIEMMGPAKYVYSGKVDV